MTFLLRCASGGSVGTATPRGAGNRQRPRPPSRGNATALPSSTDGVGAFHLPSAIVSNTALPSTWLEPRPCLHLRPQAPRQPLCIGVRCWHGSRSVGQRQRDSPPATVVGTGSVPPATAAGTATALLATVAGVGAITTPSSSGTAIASAATVAGIGDVPAPTAVGTTSGTAAPAVVTGVATITTPTATGTAFTTPATVAGIGTVPTADVTGTAVASGATVVGTRIGPASHSREPRQPPKLDSGYRLYAPVSALGAATAAPATTAATGSVPHLPPRADRSARQRLERSRALRRSHADDPPDGHGYTGSVAAIGASLLRRPRVVRCHGIAATVAGIGSVPAPNAVGGTASTATPSTVQGVASIPTPTAYGAFGAFPATVAGSAAITTPTGTGDGVAHPVSIAAIGNVPPPSDVGQIRGEWRQTNGASWGPAAAKSGRRPTTLNGRPFLDSVHLLRRPWCLP